MQSWVGEGVGSLVGEGVGLGVRVGLAVNVLYVYVIDEQKIIDMRMMWHKWYWFFGK